MIFPCKHDLYEWCQVANDSEPLSRLQHYCPEEFVHQLNPDCLYCKAEIGPLRVPVKEMVRAKKSA